MIIDQLRLRLPSVAKAVYRQRFIGNKNENLFLGSFDSFEAAQQAAPKGKAVGYDNAEAAKDMYSPQVCTWDYPALYWLSDGLHAGMTTVFDLGGHVGIKYYAFKRVAVFPESLRWTVCDVPGVVRTGEELALSRHEGERLQFCTDHRLASGSEILLLSGSLQYLPQRLAEILASLSVKPRRVILNITAVHALRTIYTLNSIGFAVCPYRIQIEEELLNEIRQAGYRRRDRWRNDGKVITVPFEEGGDGAYYFGCCFDLEMHAVDRGPH